MMRGSVDCAEKRGGLMLLLKPSKNENTHGPITRRHQIQPFPRLTLVTTGHLHLQLGSVLIPST